MNQSIHLRLRIYILLLFIVVITGVIGMTVLEQLSPLDSLYFTIVTIATVGFGDIHPVTPFGKLLVIGMILVGVSCFVGVAGSTIEYMIEKREHTMRMHNLNMIVGVFFSEVGTSLLKQFNAHDPGGEKIRSALKVSNNWSPEDFSSALETLRHYESHLDSRNIPLDKVHEFLSKRREFMISLFGNPRISENDRFTPLLRAVFHLAEELDARDRLTSLPSSDYDHLSGDINRVNDLLVVEWLIYMQHLKKHYPYLFSLAMRTNPFDEHASGIVQ
ncbi:MAG: potassium channel family protein [Methanoregula sp.]